MVDRLEREILEIIAKASSLVRTVTRKEIETGVLFPSVTAMDIRRNLPSTVQLSVIESRLQLLEKEGYIFNEGGRWWLTRKGQQEVGFQSEKQSIEEKLNRPITSQIEESFAEHGGSFEHAEYRPVDRSVESLLEKLEELYADAHLTKEERIETARNMISGLLGGGDSLRRYLESRSLELNSEIERLELELSKKKNELRLIRQVIGEK